MAGPAPNETGSSPAVEAVLFDLDHTLCEPRRSTGEVLAAAFERAGVDPFFDADDYRRWIPEFDADSAGDLRRRCFRAIAEESGRSRETARRVAEAYGEVRDPTDVRSYPGTERVLEGLAGEYRLGLVTNGARETQRAKLDRLGIADRFDVATFPETTGEIKPSPAPFRHALDALDTSPERAVHVGDSLRSDVAGANALGIRSVWVPGDDAAPVEGPTPIPTHVVDSVGSLVTPPWR